LEKPRGEADHIRMLKMLRDDGTHKVMTAMAVMKPLESAVDPGYRMETHVEETTVKFDPEGLSRRCRNTISQDWSANLDHQFPTKPSSHTCAPAMVTTKLADTAFKQLAAY
jgi:hypothetical protein